MAGSVTVAVRRAVYAVVQDLLPSMSETADQTAGPTRSRRASSQRVREARDRLTSTSGTRPAFDHELLRQYAQTRLSASLVVVLLVVATGMLSSFWVPPIGAAVWTFGILSIHAIVVRYCSKFLTVPSAPAETRKWRMRFVVLDLLYGLAWTLILIHPSGIDVVSNTLMLFVMLLVVAVSSMLAAGLPIAAFAATVPVTPSVGSPRTARSGAATNPSHGATPTI